MKKFLAVFFVSFYLLLPTAIAENIFPALTGHVVDEAGVLNPQTKYTLDKLLASDSDNQVVIAVLNDLRGKDGREYGVELARHWQLGQKGKDNGVLILLSVKDRYVGIEVGYGLEDILTDSLSGRILQYKILPPIQQNQDYNQALLNGAAAVMSAISGQTIKDLPENEDITTEDILSLLFTLLMIYLILKGKGPRGGGGMFLGGGKGGFFRGGGGSFGGGGAGRRF